MNVLMDTQELYPSQSLYNDVVFPPTSFNIPIAVLMVYEFIYGTVADDVFELSGDYKNLTTYAGNDSVNLTGNHNIVSAGADNDTVVITGSSNEINLDAGDDTLHANIGSHDNTVYGGLGKDYVKVRGDDNQFYGGDDDDWLMALGLNNKLYGGVGNDRIETRVGYNELYGEEGNDVLEGWGEHTLMDGGAGNDRFGNWGDHNTFLGQGGDDHIRIFGSYNEAYGGDGNDYIKDYYFTGHNIMDGGSGQDSIYAGGGDDLLIYHYGENVGYYDYYSGQNDHDTLVLNFTQAEINSLVSSLNLASANDYIKALHQAFTDANGEYFNYSHLGFNLTAGRVETLVTKVDGIEVTPTNNQGDDTYIYDYTVEALQSTHFDAGAGVDTLEMHFSYNELEGLVANGASDTVSNLVKSINDKILTQADLLDFNEFGFALTARDVENVIFNIEGAQYTPKGSVNGTHQISASGEPNANVRFYAGHYAEGILGSLDNDAVIINGEFQSANLAGGDDTLTLTGSDNQIDVGDGNDVLSVFGDRNMMSGTAGHHNCSLHGHSNKLNTSDGADNVTVRGNTNELSLALGNDNVNLEGNGNIIDAGAGDNRISVRGENNVIETADGRDDITVMRNNNVVYSGAGDDKITLRSNGQVVYAGDGNDNIRNMWSNYAKIYAGNGNDEITSEGVYNELFGEGGNDRFTIYNSHNVVHGGAGDDWFRDVYFVGVNTFDGGSGNDSINADGGDDTLIYHYGENIGYHDSYDGSLGVDTLIIHFTSDEVQNLSTTYQYGSVIDYIEAIHIAVKNGNAGHVGFASLGFNLNAYGIDRVVTKVDGEDVYPVKAILDSVTISEDSFEQSIDVVANDNFENSAQVYEIDGRYIFKEETITRQDGTSITLQDNGELVFRSEGTFHHLAQGEQESVTFNYRIKDSQGTTSNEAQVTVTVNGVNDAPTVLADQFIAFDNKVITGNVFFQNGHGADSDSEGDDFYLAFVNGQAVGQGITLTLASGASLSVSAEGAFSYDSHGVYDHLSSLEEAKDSFTYQARDNLGALSDSAQVSILHSGADATSLPQLSIMDASVLEKDTGETSLLEFKLVLSQASTDAVTVDYTTSGLTALTAFDKDYIPHSGTVIFNPGETSNTISFEVVGDNAFEANETLNIHLQNVAGATVLHDSAIGTILNDDREPTGPLDVPILNSNINSNNVIYLDFDGAYVSGTEWNTDFTGGADIVADPFSFDDDKTTFNAEEIAAIKESWLRVAEDYAPFDVNITTDRSIYEETSSFTRLSAVITEKTMFSFGGGGRGYYGIWNRPDDQKSPAWVFVNTNAKDIGDVITHEIGHNLQLAHDGDNTTEYYEGHGAGETGWASIMGLHYFHDLTQWSKGEYSNANNKEDDLGIIGSKLGFKADDHGNDAMNASLIHLGEGLAGRGIIHHRTDVDVFKLDYDGDINLSVTGLGRHTNLDILAELKDAAGNVLASSNPLESLNANITYSTHGQEELYIEISGTGKGDPLGDGYSDYGSLGYYQMAFIN